jgi:hypothetical protein
MPINVNTIIYIYVISLCDLLMINILKFEDSYKYVEVNVILLFTALKISECIYESASSSDECNYI